MGKPLIGITTYVVPAKWSYWDLEAALVPTAYVQAVEQAGGRALLVPPAENAVAEQALDACSRDEVDVVVGEDPGWVVLVLFVPDDLRQVLDEVAAAGDVQHL